MVDVRESAAAAVERLKETASQVREAAGEAQAGVKSVSGEARAQARKLTGRLHRRARRRRRIGAAAIVAGVAIAAITIALVQLGRER